MKKSFNNHYKPAILWLDSCQRYFGWSPTESIHLMLTHGFVLHCGLCVCVYFCFWTIGIFTNQFEMPDYEQFTLEPVGKEKMSLTCHSLSGTRHCQGGEGRWSLRKKAKSNLSMKKCGEKCPVEKHILCNLKSFVFPWKTNSITVKILIKAELIHEPVTNPPTLYYWSIATWNFHRLIFFSMTLEHETTDPNERFPKCSTVLSFGSLKRFIWGYCHVKGN